MFSLVGCTGNSSNQTSVTVEKQSATPNPTPTPCSINVSQSPTIRGIKLGMTISEVKILTPELTSFFNSKLVPPKTDKYGELNIGYSRGTSAGEYFLHGQDYIANFGIDGVRDVDLDFLDEELTGFNIDYGSGAWENYEQFATAVIPLLGLPGEWGTDSIGRKTLKCSDFVVQVYWYEVSLRSLKHYEIINERKRVAEEKRRAEEEAKKDGQRKAFKL